MPSNSNKKYFGIDYLLLLILLAVVIYYFYQGLSFQYISTYTDRYGYKTIVSKLSIEEKQVVYLHTRKHESTGNSFEKIIRLNGCKFINSSTWDCYIDNTSAESDYQLKMIGGKLSMLGSGELDRYLILPWGREIKF